LDVFCVGKEKLYEVELENGLKIKCTREHEFLCSDGKKHTLNDIIENNLEICCVYT
jgi:intein/homing endonuclease